jgi:phosphonate transport system substrate-binding protein
MMEASSKGVIMKRQFSHVLASATVALAVFATPASVRAQATEYTFSPVNQFDIKLTASYWNPIIAYVSEKSGIKLNLKIGRTSADTTSYVLAKEVEFIFSNHLFSPDRDQLGWKVIGRRQTPSLQGQILVPSDSPMADISQLKGQEVAFAGKEAFLGYKVPMAHLLSKNVDVKVVFAGNQNAAFAQMFSGKAMAVGSNSQLVDGYARRESKAFKVLWSSESFQDLALMVSSKVPDKDAKAVLAAFVDMSRDPKGRDILHAASKEIGLPADAYFIPATNADYAAYRRFYQSAPASLH